MIQMQPRAAQELVWGKPLGVNGNEDARSPMLNREQPSSTSRLDLVDT